MSIIHQALKKAQSERQQTQHREPWVQSALPGTAPRSGRRPILWVVFATVLALACSVVVLGWLNGPTANLPNVLIPVRPVADATPQWQPVHLTKPPPRTSVSSPPAKPPAPSRRPTPSTTSIATPVQSVQLNAARQPVFSPQRYIVHGNRLYRQGRYQDAIALYQSALALQPDSLKARNNLGIAYMQLAMDDRAAATFEEILRLDSTYGIAYYNLACVHARAGNVAGAADYLQRAMDIEPRARDWARADRDFALVRDMPQFHQHLEP